MLHCDIFKPRGARTRAELVEIGVDPLRIAYLVHDLNDAAVERRVAMFEESGVPARVAGFRRRDHVPARIRHAPAADLGRTADGKLKERALAVLRHWLFPGRVSALTQDAQTIVARNLETLVLARRVRRPGQRLVYECLDIHRLLLGKGLASRLLRGIERWAMRGVDLLIVSSPSFLSEYFAGRGGYRGHSLLIENKVPGFAGSPSRSDRRSPGPIWVIGWFGMLRCRKSLDQLSAIAAQAGGRIQVVIAGRASPQEFADFEAQVAATPHLRYLGPYRPDDLPALYASVHFVWAIDYFEEGLNSSWLLPNRLYEGLANGAVPLALRSVATGGWLKQAGVGLLLDDPAAELPPLLDGLSADDHDMLADAVRDLPTDKVLMSREECHKAVRTITGAAR